MAVFNNILAGASGQAGGAGAYEIERSLRFNSSDSAYLSRTLGSPTNQNKWTFSFWMKLGFTSSSSIPTIIGADTDSSSSIHFENSNQLRVAWTTGYLELQRVFRDLSAWYHVTVVADTQNSTVSSKLKIYVNGDDQEGAYSVDNRSTLGSSSIKINSAVSHFLCTNPAASSRYFSGYLADVHFIDGQALDPTSFTETDATTGQLVPIEYTGTYGTNGFHLPFSDNSSAAALGTDTSGNSNTWTVNNISVTAGSGNDSLVDTPTNGSQTDTGVGGEVVGNYCTWNPLILAGDVTLSNGNLDYSSTGGDTYQRRTLGTFTLPSSGKWYWEITVTTVGEVQIGVMDWYTNNRSFYYQYGGGGFLNIRVNESTIANAPTIQANDVIGVTYDSDNQQIRWYRNNSAVVAAQSLTNTGRLCPYVENGTGSGGNLTQGSVNFGQRPFAYTAPSGFKALCTANLDDPVVAQPSTVMDVKLYTGNGSTQTISGLGFSPDFVWIKTRSASGYAHILQDTVRGAGKSLATQNTNLEVGNAGDFIGSFNSDGFSVNTTYLGGTAPETNGNGDTFVAWTWDAGDTTDPANEDGSITSQVRANASAGFSIVTYTGTGTGSTVTVGHGLNVAPKLYIIKDRDLVENWFVYTTVIDGSLDYLFLNTTAAAGNSSLASPTSSVFSASGVANSLNSDFVAYCFAPVDGYSSFGSYTGNGSTDGPFVFTGMRPRWVMIKRTDTTNYWIIQDAARNGYNVVNLKLAANTANAENDLGTIGDTSQNTLDYLSNGFKCRTGNAGTNVSGGTYIYAAFAESPQKYARAR